MKDLGEVRLRALPCIAWLPHYRPAPMKDPWKVRLQALLSCMRYRSRAALLLCSVRARAGYVPGGLAAETAPAAGGAVSTEKKRKDSASSDC